MKKYTIYTAGKMGGLTFGQQMSWRLKLDRLVNDKADNVKFIHPPLYYTYGERFHKTELEAKTWDLNQIYNSDIVVVDLSTINDSIGTHIELGFIEAINRYCPKQINLLGLGKPNTDHPWIELGFLRTEDTVEELADYICGYLLV